MVSEIHRITDQLTTGACNRGGRIIDYLLFTIDYWRSAEGAAGNTVMVVL